MIILPLTLLSLLGLSQAYHLPRTSPAYQKPRRFPQAVQVQGHKVAPDLQIPNEKFCRNMQLQPYRHYMILPWWYVHCERLLEKEERIYRNNKKLLPIYSRILGIVQQYKKKQALLEAMNRYL